MSNTSTMNLCSNDSATTTAICTNALGRSILFYRGVNSQTYANAGYDLKNNGSADYSDLIEFLDILNRTPPADLPCELEEVFNVDSYLKVIAFDIFSGNWDGPIYNKNNCYLYKNTATGKFEYIPFDLDNTFRRQLVSEY